jgi:hypothetical protein
VKTLSEDNNRGFVGLKDAVAEMARRIGQVLLDIDEPIKMVIAGGVAVNFYTGSRATLDVDASFSKRLMLPDDLVIPYAGPDGRILSIHLDRNYNTTFAVMHEDYEDDALPVEGKGFDNDKIKVFLLSPLDLAVSKISRFEGPDRDDIAALARQGLIYPKALAERANEAMAYYVGSQDRVRANLRDALKTVELAQREVKAESKENGHGR